MVSAGARGVEGGRPKTPTELMPQGFAESGVAASPRLSAQRGRAAEAPAKGDHSAAILLTTRDSEHRLGRLEYAERLADASAVGVGTEPDGRHRVRDWSVDYRVIH